MQQAPVIQLPDHGRQFVVTADASDYCYEVVLSQLNSNGEDLSVLLLSKKLGKQELNWAVYENELYAICLEVAKWRHYLWEAKFGVYTDNSACKWVLTMQASNSR